MTFWGRLSVWLQPFWGCLSFWNTSSWPLCLCGIPDHDLPRSFVCVGYQIMTFWGHLSVRDIGLRPFLRSSVLVEYPAYDLLRSFVCGLQPFWGRLSLWNTSLWPSEVVCLCGISDYDLFEVVLSFWKYQLMTFWGHLSVDYNLFEVVCPCGIPAYDLLRSFVCGLQPFKVVCSCGITAYDLLRSFVCAGYRITIFLWSVCPFGIPAYDLLRSFGCVGYQLMTFWGHLSVQNTGLRPFWGRLSFWNTSSWPFEVVCLCGIPDYNLFEVVCPFENTSSWPFEVVCLWGISDYDLFRSFVCAEYQIMTFWGRLITAYDLLRSFVCAKYRITTFWNTSSWPFEVLCLCGLWPFWGRLSFWNTSSWLWGRLSVRNIGFMTFWGRLSVWYTALMTFEVICFCGITGLWPF